MSSKLVLFRHMTVSCSCKKYMLEGESSVTSQQLNGWSMFWLDELLEIEVQPSRRRASISVSIGYFGNRGDDMLP